MYNFLFNIIKREKGSCSWVFEEIGTELPLQDGTTTPVSIASFLNGFCPHLAWRLKKEFGYQLACLKEDEELVHVFCVGKKDGHIFFIDVRGITDDIPLFYGPFSVNVQSCFNEEDVERTISATEPKYVVDEISDAMVDWVMNAFGSNYDINKI